MDDKAKQAFDWALNQNFGSVAAQYAKILATHIQKSNDMGESTISFLRGQVADLHMCLHQKLTEMSSADLTKLYNKIDDELNRRVVDAEFSDS